MSGPSQPALRGRVLLGVTGGVAAFKAAALASRLAQQGAELQVVLTDCGARFVGPATFAALAQRPVAGDTFDPRWPLGAHIELARWGQLLCVAPATAHFLARAAQGLAEDLLTTTYLAFTGPVLMAPAMNTEMWQHPAVQRNVQQLQQDGVRMVGPGSGWLSCRTQGPGRMAEPEEILLAVADTLADAGAPD